MITQEKIDRINELARKDRETGVTPEEKQEWDLLRREYIDAFKANLRAQLDSIRIVDPEKEEQLEEDLEELEDDLTKIQEDIETIEEEPEEGSKSSADNVLEKYLYENH